MDSFYFEVDMRMRYAVVRSAVADASPITVLHIGDVRSGIAVGSGAVVQSTLAMAIGAERIAREHFRHAPPSPLELENVIVTVENEVTRARPLIAKNSRLYTTDTALREIALLAGVTEAAQMQLSLQAVENTFDRLAAIALGRPTSADSLFDSGAFDARLLILREFMHHLQFSSITVLKAQ